jgi:hypothetical protein
MISLSPLSRPLGAWAHKPLMLQRRPQTKIFLPPNLWALKSRVPANIGWVLIFGRAHFAPLNFPSLGEER